MNNKHFFLTLAFQNIKKNGKFYFPYLLTFIGTVAVFYIMSAISINRGIASLPGTDSMQIIMTLGTGVIAIFSVIFLFYTNSFLIKRRKKEFGLYSILGMEKRHVAKVLFAESLMIAVAGIAGGLMVGILFNKLLLMLLVKMIKVEVAFQFSIEVSSIVQSCILFGAIFIFTFLYNEIVMLRTKTTDLLKGEKMGEREPKTKWFSAIFGAVCITAGYYIALTVKNPLDAFNLFFIAVVLVIAGTYSLFSAGSIVVLKMLRKNKKYYYQINHFTAVSGMIYRMKQNAAGLASICILSTMVLVIISTTTCLYAGVEDALRTRYTHSFMVNMENVKKDFDEDAFKGEVLNKIEDTCKVTDYEEFYNFYFITGMLDGKFIMDDFTTEAISDYHEIDMYTLEYYNKMTGQNITLQEHEVLAYDTNIEMPKHFSLGQKDFEVVDYVECFLGEEYQSGFFDMNVHYIVVENLDIMLELAEQLNAGDVVYSFNVNVKGKSEDQIAVFKELVKMQNVYVEARENERGGFLGIYGGLLFLGLFLGSVFIMATTLIIYYKQISEGYDDKDRFEIMQKVGMSKKEIKGSISSQVIMVFFLPLITAGIHALAAFPMVEKMLFLLELSDTTPFIWCLAGTVAAFAVVYGIVYSMTSKVYYKIVE